MSDVRPGGRRGGGDNCDLIIEVESDPTRRTLHVRPFISSDGNGSRVVKKRKDGAPEKRRKGKRKRERERERGRERARSEGDKTKVQRGTEFLIKFLFRSSYPRSTGPDKAVRVKRSYRK